MPARGEKEGHGRAAVEEHTQIDSEFVEEAEEIALVAVIGLAKSTAGDGLVNFEAFRLIALANGFHDDPSLLGHADGGKAVQNGKGLLTGKALHGSLGAAFVIGMRLDEILDAFAQESGCGELHLIEVGQLLKRCAIALWRNPIEALELLGEFLGDEASGISHEMSQTVACS